MPSSASRVPSPPPRSRRAASRVRRSALLSTNRIRSACPASDAQVRVQPRVVVLLRIRHPGHRVDPRQDLIDPGAVLVRDAVHVGQVQDDHRRQLRIRMPDRVTHAQPRSRSPASSRTAAAATHASGSSVVGRTARTALTVWPASALSSDDLPTPVPARQRHDVGGAAEAGTLLDRRRPRLRGVGLGRDSPMEPWRRRPRCPGPRA